MKKFLMGICAVSLLFSGCGNTEPKQEPQAVKQEQKKIKVRKLDQDKAMEMLAADPNGKLLDCRFPKDYELRHIPGAINFPLEFAVAENFEQIPDKNALLITYCGDGNRGGLTAKALIEKGYTNVYTMGGILDWKGEVEGTEVDQVLGGQMTGAKPTEAQENENPNP